MRSIKEIKNCDGKKVLIRADFNVPVSEGKVSDDFRIKKFIPTLDYLLTRGARIILMSHTEAGEGSLQEVREYLSHTYKVSFIDSYYPKTPKLDFNSGGIVLLENLRKYHGEKENSDEFSKHLASFVDFYVNEAFSVCHRNHASIVGVPKYIPSFAGLNLLEEISHLSKAFSPEHPFLFILGGAKAETKLPLIKKFYDIADRIFIGGALVNDFLRAKGYPVGHSLVSETRLDFSSFLTEKLILPDEVCVERNGRCIDKPADEISDHEYVVDVGIESVRALRSVINNSRFILWNGPLGNYEQGHKGATHVLANLIGESTAHSIVGGGDTVASIAELGIFEKFSFVSTGGGAMLDFLTSETLPGIEALNGSASQTNLG